MTNLINITWSSIAAFVSTMKFTEIGFAIKKKCAYCNYINFKRICFIEKFRKKLGKNCLRQEEVFFLKCFKSWHISENWYGTTFFLIKWVMWPTVTALLWGSCKCSFYLSAVLPDCAKKKKKHPNLNKYLPNLCGKPKVEKLKVSVVCFIIDLCNKKCVFFK